MPSKMIQSAHAYGSMPGIGLGTRNTAVNKTNTAPVHLELTILALREITSTLLNLLCPSM